MDNLYRKSSWRRDFRGYHVSMAACLEVRELIVEIPTPRGRIFPVREVSFSLRAGETLGVVGESGSGKTMLALALLGLLPPGARSTGQAWLDLGVDAKNDQDGSASQGPVNVLALSAAAMRAIRGRRMAMIFQEPMTALNPVMQIGSQIEEAIRIHSPHLDRAEIERRAMESLTRASVPEPGVRARQYAHQLSGGLRQRVMIAMALAAHPGLLIADEPTTALDVTVQKQILELLAGLRRDLGLAMIFITHDLGVVAQVADRLAVIYAGRIVEEGPAGEILRRPRHPYTQGLLRAAPRLTREKIEPIPGAVPALDALPAGCAFAPRCAFRVEECEAALPQLRSVTPEHRARCILVP